MVEAENFFCLIVLKGQELQDELNVLFLMARKDENVTFISKLVSYLIQEKLPFSSLFRPDDIEFFVSRAANLGHDLLKSHEAESFSQTILKTAIKNEDVFLCKASLKHGATAVSLPEDLKTKFLNLTSDKNVSNSLKPAHKTHKSEQPNSHPYSCLSFQVNSCRRLNDAGPQEESRVLLCIF
jgi:hypothetical protein